MSQDRSPQVDQRVVVSMKDKHSDIVERAGVVEKVWSPTMVDLSVEVVDEDGKVTNLKRTSVVYDAKGADNSWRFGDEPNEGESIQATRARTTASPFWKP